MPTLDRVLTVVTGEWQSTGQIARQLIDRSLPHRIRKDHHAAVVRALREAHGQGLVEWRYRENESDGKGAREWRALDEATAGR